MAHKQVPKQFGDLAIGDCFSMSPIDEQSYPTYLWNVKVEKSALTAKEEFGGFGPFNVIDLSNGRPRTFRDSELVYLRNLKDAMERSERDAISYMRDNGF